MALPLIIVPLILILEDLIPLTPSSPTIILLADKFAADVISPFPVVLSLNRIISVASASLNKDEVGIPV